MINGWDRAVHAQAANRHIDEVEEEYVDQLNTMEVKKHLFNEDLVPKGSLGSLGTLLDSFGKKIKYTANTYFIQESPDFFH